MHPLASRTMAVLARQGLFSAQFILNRAAVAFALPFRIEIVALLVDSVWSAELPLVFGAVGPVAGLVLVRLVAVGSLVAFFVFVHFGETSGCRNWLEAGGRERGCGEKFGRWKGSLGEGAGSWTYEGAGEEHNLLFFNAERCRSGLFTSGGWLFSFFEVLFQ